MTTSSGFNGNTQIEEDGLTNDQRSVLVGLNLSDSHLERSSPTSGTRLCVQFTVGTPGLFKYCFDMFSSFLSENELKKNKSIFVDCMGDNKQHEQLLFRTRFNDIFTPFHEAFYIMRNGVSLKVFPTVTFLLKYLNDTALAVLLMCDGSRKGINNFGYEIHCQGNGFESAVRLCLALYEKFGLECWPTLDNYPQKGVSYWNIYISAASFNDWAPRVQNLMDQCGMTDQKMPTLSKTLPKQKTIQTNTGVTTSRIRNYSNKFNQFLTLFQNNMDIRENIQYQASQDLLDQWREIQKLRK
jgi:hypothetical protein